MSRDDYTRRYCFTWNNYPETAEAQIRSFHDQRRVIYTVVGREIGTNGTKHLQGYFHLKDRMGFSRLKELFPFIHIERAKGNAEQNKMYCSKDQDFFEMGTCPKSSGNASKESWKEILQAAESGNWQFLKDNYPRVWVTMSEKLISKRIPDTSVMDGIVNEWWYGDTGTGKSRLAWEKYGVICYQKMLNKWWDGYDAQSVVIIEEWSPKNEVTASALKIWADRYPFTAQIKGGVLQKIRPKKLIVISNYTLRDCFPDTRDADPLARRFKQIKFPTSHLEAAMLADSFLISVKSNDAQEMDISQDETSVSNVCAAARSSTEDAIMAPYWLDNVTGDQFMRVIESAARLTTTTVEGTE